jgi:hypothetical protein
MKFSILKDYYIWRERLAIIRDLYLEVEILSILEDNNRKCNMFILPPHVLERYMNTLILPNGLDIEIIGTTGSSNGFAHNINMLNGSDKSVHGVVYKNKQDGLDFVEAYRNENNDRMGELLGYPKCCRDLYNHLHNGKLNIIDIVVPQYLGVGKIEGDSEINVEGSPYTNAMIRYIGARFSPHMPCSPECKESIELAKSVELTMRKVDSTSADYVMDMLSMPTKFISHEGFATITTPVVEITVPNYDWGKKITINHKASTVCP